MYDIFSIGLKDPSLREKFPFLKTATSIEDASKKSLTRMFWVIWNDIQLNENFNFDLTLKEWDQKYIHVFKNGEHSDGVFLIPKDMSVSTKEQRYRFFNNKKEWDIVASTPKLYNIFEIDSYEDYLDALENSTTEMFWAVSKKVKAVDDFKFDLYFPHYDVYNRNENHVFKNQTHSGDTTYDGIWLLSKNKPLSKKEVEFRHVISRKEWDIIASKDKLYDRFVVDSYDEYVYALENSTTEMFWAISNKVVPCDFKFDLFFDFRSDEFIFDRNTNHVFKNRAYNGDTTYDGIWLLSKNTPVSKREINSRHIIDRKEWDIIASKDKLYDQFVVDSYDEYLYALETSTTEMFWATSRNIQADKDFKFDLLFDFRSDEFIFDRNTNHVFIHRVGNKDLYNGIFLFSKNTPVSKREINSRHIIDRKEWNIVASGPVEYDKFIIDTYEDYLEAEKKSATEMFWIIPKEVEVDKEFKFDLYFSHDDEYNRNIHHSFKHSFKDEENYNGINLVSKAKPLSKKEIEYRSIIEYKPYDILVSKLKPYDAIFISYNEPNADENYERLLKLYPNAKRVHGVKGIHNAHIKAAQLSDTEMFWVVDGDAYIVDDFKFDYQVPIWDRNAVHVWRSKNPINDLVYGYGGIKLLPRKLTLNLDVKSTDMTTSISNEFKIIHEVSNITAFNTDPFNTWKSAFRECVKLSSKVIDRQSTEETTQRLEVWKTIAHGNFAEYSIKGAKDAEQFVSEGNNVALINDFDYLQQLFNK